MFNTEPITSQSNNTIKYIMKLHQKKYRKQYDAYIIEGFKAVAEAVQAGADIEMIVFSDQSSENIIKLSEKAMESGISCITAAKKLFDLMADTQNPEGVLAVVKKPKIDPGSILDRQSCFILVLDGVRDPGNLGTIIRTMDAAGGDGIFLVNDCVDPYNLKVVRSTMGSILRMPVAEFEADEMLEALKKHNFHTAVSHLKGENIFQWDNASQKIAVVIGSESHGVSEAAGMAADSLIKIPMSGGAESLNASVAAGIIIYDMVRRRLTE